MASDTVNKDWGTKVYLVGKIEQIFCHYFCKLLLFFLPRNYGKGCVCVCVHRCMSVSAYASVWVWFIVLDQTMS